MRLHPWLSLVLSFAVLLVVGGVVSASGPRLDGADTVAAVPNVFTFRGRLQQNGAPVNGTCDLQFVLYNAGTGGADVGGGPQTFPAQRVTNGLFTVNLPWGDVFTGEDRWIEQAIRCPAGAGSYTTLAPREQVWATPYAFGLRLPFSGRFASSDALFNLSNSGTGGAAALSVANAGATAPALTVTTDSTQASAIYAELTTASSANGQSAIVGANKSTTSQGIGVSGTQDGRGYGVYGRAPGGMGVYGEADTGIGVYGMSTSGTGVYGYSPVGIAGYFTGHVVVRGDLTITGDVTRSFPGGNALAQPIAYATISAAGTLLAGTPNVSVTYSTFSRRYEITLTDEVYYSSRYITTVTAVSSAPIIPSTDYLAGKLHVYLHDLKGAATQSDFSVVVYKP